MKKLKLFILISLFTTYSYASHEENFISPNSDQNINRILSEKDIFDKYDKHLVELLQARELHKKDILNLYTVLDHENNTILEKAYMTCIEIFKCIETRNNETDTYNKINNAYTFLLTQDYKSGLITNCMGYCLEIGLGIEQNIQKAIELYTKAADLGNYAAMYNLAYIYEKGTNGVEKDIQKAIELYTKAFDLGNSTAMNNLAGIYYNGTNGVEKDIQKAIELYTKAANLGNSAAMFNLARTYKNGTGGIEKDIKKAIALYTKASELGNSVAMNKLASIYENGKNGVQQNIQKAIELYTKASELGNPQAMNNLACIYYHEKNGVEQDIQKVMELSTKASELGNSTAIYNLACIYQKGINGVQQNIQKAIELYTKAVELGNSSAMINLASIYENGENGVQQNIQKAIELYTEASELGESYAMNNLAYIYYDGTNGVEKNIPKAIELYTKAVDLGSSDAMGNLAAIYSYERNVQNLKYAQILKILQKEESTLEALSENEIFATKFIFTLFNKGDFSKNILIESKDNIKVTAQAYDEQVLGEKYGNFGIECFDFLNKENCPSIKIWLEVKEVAKQPYFVPISQKFYNHFECLQWEKHGQNTLTIPSHYMGLRLYKMGDSFYAAIGQPAMKYADEIMQSLEYKSDDKNLNDDLSILKKEYTELLKEYNKGKVQLFLSKKTDGLNQKLKKVLFL